MNATTVFDNNSIWIFEQIYQTLYTVTNDGKGVKPWLATSYTMSSDKKTYTFTAAQGRQVLQRQADDLGRREVLHRPEPEGHAGLGLPRLGHHLGGRPVARHRGHPPEVPVGAAARRPVDLRQRHRAEQLRRRDRERVLPAPDRHRPVQVGLLAQGLRAQAGPQPALLAEGQAVPEQRHLDRRAQRQHPGAAAQGRPGADRPDPRLVHGGQPEVHAERQHVPVPVDADQLPGLQREREAVPGRARAPGHLAGHQPERPGQGRAVRQRQASELAVPAAGALLPGEAPRACSSTWPRPSRRWPSPACRTGSPRRS